MPDWQVVGRQKFLVADDMVQWDVLADVTVAELDQILQACLSVQTVNGYALLLVTARGGSWAFPAPARKHLAQFHRQNKAVGATALVGATPSMTIIIDLVLRAVTMVSGHRPASRFFHSGDEALIWLEEQRGLGKKGLLTHK